MGREGSVRGEVLRVRPWKGGCRGEGSLIESGSDFDVIESDQDDQVLLVEVAGARARGIEFGEVDHIAWANGDLVAGVDVMAQEACDVSLLVGGDVVGDGISVAQGDHGHVVGERIAGGIPVTVGLLSAESEVNHGPSFHHLAMNHGGGFDCVVGAEENAFPAVVVSDASLNGERSVVAADLEGGTNDANFHLHASLGDQLVLRGDIDEVVDILGILDVPGQYWTNSRRDPQLVDIESADGHMGISGWLVGESRENTKRAQGKDCGEFHGRGCSCLLTSSNVESHRSTDKNSQAEICNGVSLSMNMLMLKISRYPFSKDGFSEWRLGR